MSKSGLLASAFSFAHLMGRAPASAAVDDEKKDDKESKRAEGDEDEKKDDEKKDDKESKRAEGDEDEKKDDEKKDDKESKRAEDDDDEMKGRVAERTRWASVLGSPVAAGRVGSACQLLATSDLGAKQILGFLKTVPVEGTARTSLSDRMAQTQLPNPGGGGAEAPAAGDSKSLAGAIIAAAAKARGEKAA